MTKQEAIDAMLRGEKVTHRYFTSEEWITAKTEVLYETEDGYMHPAHLFWKYRRDDAWQTDWSIFQPKTPTP